MLKSINRLKKDSAFQAVFRSGNGFKTPHISGGFLANNSADSRFGVVISRKVSALAVRRNRLRRIIAAELADLLRKDRPQQGSDVVLRITKLPEGDPTTQIRQEVRQWFAKLLSS